MSREAKRLESEKIVQELTIRIRKNTGEITEAQAKSILQDIGIALVELLVGTEPKLADPNLDVDKKVKPFFKAILKLGGEGLEAYMSQHFFPEKLKAFERKIERFKNLEHALILLMKQYGTDHRY